MIDIRTRGSGLLLHLASLPSGYGIGDMGPRAYQFIDNLRKAHQIYWQILPLTPVEPSRNISPYNSTSVFAGNRLLISPELLLKEGFIEKLKPKPDFRKGAIDFQKASSYRDTLFEEAFKKMRQEGYPEGYRNFSEENDYWLEDYAFFEALRGHFGRKVEWNRWPDSVRDRDDAVLNEMKNRLIDDIDREKFIQFLFHRQWKRLKQHCNENSVQIIGDMAIYVHLDSVDVWMNPEIFKLDNEKKPLYVSGVPPDYFSDTGQLWGNPVYRWDVMKKNNFRWWMNRIRRNLELYDILRIDHFRGFSQYWEVDASEKTAIDGKWRDVPKYEFFDSIFKRFPNATLIAEDLGVITPDVREMMYNYNLPGLKVLMFAFDENMSDSPYIPHNIPRNSVVYPGTHDNNTIRGWYEMETDRNIRDRISRYFGIRVTKNNVNRTILRASLSAPANTSIVAVQDLLGLGEEARMNDPSSKEGNWKWMMTEEDWDLLVRKHLNRFAEMTRIYGRAKGC